MSSPNPTTPTPTATKPVPKKISNDLVANNPFVEFVKSGHLVILFDLSRQIIHCPEQGLSTALRFDEIGIC